MVCASAHTPRAARGHSRTAVTENHYIEKSHAAPNFNDVLERSIPRPEPRIAPLD